MAPKRDAMASKGDKMASKGAFAKGTIQAVSGLTFVFLRMLMDPKGLTLFVIIALSSLSWKYSSLTLQQTLHPDLCLVALSNSSKTMQKSGSSSFPLAKTSATEEVVYVVISRRNAANVRQSIRETWARGKDNVYFVLGKECAIHPAFRVEDSGGNILCALQPIPLAANYFERTKFHVGRVRREDSSLKREQAQHRDLILMDEVDIYRNLPKKLKAAYSFVDWHIPQAKWIVKIDDDFFARVDQFSGYLLKHFNSSVPCVVGRIMAEQQVPRFGKYAEVPQYPQDSTYPMYPIGSYGHAVTRPVVEFVSQNQDALFDYQGEDSSLGIWLTQPSAPTVRFEDGTSVMRNDGNCTDPQSFIVGHKLKPASMLKCNASN